MEVTKTAEQLSKNRIIISDPEKYKHVEIRNMNYDDGEGLAGYNGNVVLGYADDLKDVFFLSVNKIKDEDMDAVCEKILEQFGQDNKLINLIIYNGESTIYNLNDEADEEAHPEITS